MKATGIVRRIDDLGRIVIPKEIRRVLRIRESDPLEIFTDHEGSIILRKYSPIGDMGSFAKPFAEISKKISPKGYFYYSASSASVFSTGSGSSASSYFSNTAFVSLSLTSWLIGWAIS